MTSRVTDALGGAAVVVKPGDSLAEAADVMAAGRVDHVAVVADGCLVGVVAAADLDAARPSPATTLSVGEIQTALRTIPVAMVMRDVPAVSLRTPLAEAGRLMRDGELHALPVVQGDAVVGVLSDLDVLVWGCERAVAAWP
jgi:acetoin utilization protein AcuB